jgi:squalene synthase HpnC
VELIRRVADSVRHEKSSPAARPAAPLSPAPAPPNGRSLDECYAYCEALVRRHHENFPVASQFLPRQLAPHVCALYAFVRSADDFADEPEFAGRRAAELDRWEDMLLDAFHGKAEHPIFVALAATVARFELPVAPFTDLLAAFRIDLATRRYSTFAELMAYVERAAQPIGRLILYIFGARDARRHKYADDLSTALALTSFWQDLARDLPRDRVYVPKEDLAHFGVDEADLFARRQSPELAALIRYECARTRAVFERARPLLDLVDAELRTEMHLFWYGGNRALDKIEGGAKDVFGARARLSTIDKAWVLARALARR